MSEVFTAALVGGLIGTFFGGFTKFLWERWLPEWLTWRRTQRVDRERELSIIRGPAIRAFADLHFRLATVIRTQANNYKYTKSMGEGDYYVESTAYLVGRVFAWQEILRRRMATYDYAELHRKLEPLTTAFSHGMPGFQMFRLEQTEIGERLTVATDSDGATCMALSDFLDLLERNDAPRCISLLRSRVLPLLERPIDEVERVANVDKALTDILRFLDPKGRWHDGAAIEGIDVSTIINEWLKYDLISPQRAKRILASESTSINSPQSEDSGVSQEGGGKSKLA